MQFLYILLSVYYIPTTYVPYTSVNISLYSIHTALIKQLYTDGHITAKEAAELTSNKLFKVSVAAPSFQPITRTIDDIIMTTMTSSNFSTELCIRAAETTTDTTFSANVQLNNVSTGVSSPPCIAVLGEHSALPQHICMSSNSPCAAVNANKMKTIITPDVTVAATSNEGLQSEKYINDATTIFSLKKMNGRNIPHQIPIISSEIDMHSSVVTNTLLSVHDVQESSPTKGKKHSL